MLVSVAQHVGVPEHLLVAKRQLSHAVRAAVKEARCWTVDNLRPPDRRRRLHRSTSSNQTGKNCSSKPPSRVPGLAGNGQARARRLFHLLLPRIVSVETAIAAVHRIARPELIDQHGFEESAPRASATGERQSPAPAVRRLQQRAAGRAPHGSLPCTATEPDRPGSAIASGLSTSRTSPVACARSLVDRRGEADDCCHWPSAAVRARRQTPRPAARCRPARRCPPRRSRTPRAPALPGTRQCWRAEL